MRTGHGDDREPRATSVQREHPLAAKAALLAALLVFVVFWLLLAPSSAAAV